jgi:hypothetical protein
MKTIYHAQIIPRNYATATFRFVKITVKLLDRSILDGWNARSEIMSVIIGYIMILAQWRTGHLGNRANARWAVELAIVLGRCTHEFFYCRFVRWSTAAIDCIKHSQFLTITPAGPFPF